MLYNAQAKRHVEATFVQVQASDLTGLAWTFDWSAEAAKGRLVYRLMCTATPDIVEGLVSMEPRDDHVFVFLVESAPHNRSQRRRHFGVGQHLFAIACAISFRSGFDGYVAFESKTGLIDHYRRSLGAEQLGRSNRMVIATQQARQLVHECFGMEV